MNWNCEQTELLLTDYLDAFSPPPNSTNLTRM